ncbi:acyl-oxidase [Micractinium conductrix]|uniref:Acyl-coenzyme A oxidase n=1 Tax=Micractinium conductrix TaxID=554055 RepID=A0A2P6VPK6_9CHLO|nr:acyl-oxidase [Micractinium conductrix]|eukprot:PSC76022.1 acyl-oxidase [Micractinium conductrix]
MAQSARLSRCAVLQGHLAAAREHEDDRGDGLQRCATSAAAAAVPAPPAAEMNEYLTRDNKELREAIFEFLKDPLYAPNYKLSMDGFRELTSRRVAKFVAQRFFSVFDYTRDPLKFQAALECLSFCDYSLAIKSGVHFTLCGGTIAKLGTEKHHDILRKMDTLELPGCFGMTELGWGSNVMGIRTTATYDPTTQEFILNTPTNEASKFWIGGAAQTAKISAIFAQLTVDGKWEGPHVFVVRLRDDAGNFMPGVRCGDNGPKQGLLGVDNGQIWLNNVRVPRDGLLDRFAQVDAAGAYRSPIPNVAQRFGTMVGGLTTGRMLIAQGAIDACKIGVTIAIIYSSKRPQFGARPILDYLTHQRRLFPALAATYAYHLSMQRLKKVTLKGGAEAAKTVHIVSSGLKAGATWSRVRILQDCRECCGGMGFLSANRIGPMLNDMNVDTTFEGDNTVLMQQVAKALIDQAAKAGMTAPPPPPATGAAAALGSAEGLGALLDWRERMLTAGLAGELAAAGRGGADAANAAFDDALDRVVLLGWAKTDSWSYATLAFEAARTPAALRPALSLLCQLYGLSRVEAGAECYLSTGVLSGDDMKQVHACVNQLCRQLGADGGRLALALCAGFAIPPHLLQAPIALTDWRTFQG